MDPTALVLIFVELPNKVDQQLARKTSPLYKIGKFRHLLAYIGRFVFPIREPGRLYQNRESPGKIGRLERYAICTMIFISCFYCFYILVTYVCSHIISIIKKSQKKSYCYQSHLLPYTYWCYPNIFFSDQLTVSPQFFLLYTVILVEVW